MDHLLLNNMRFYAYHGVMEQERIVGNNYIVHLNIGLDLSKACQSDQIEDTVNYANVYRCVADEMEKPSQLIEHLAERICQRIRQEFKQIRQVEIHLIKCHPPISGNIESAEVILIR